jgi:hypothetical protein
MKYLLKSGLNALFFAPPGLAGDEFEQNLGDFAPFHGLEQV